MRVILFGASGMVGQGVLRECLAAGDVAEVVSVGRRPLGIVHGKLREVISNDVGDLAPVGDLSVFDACFFPLGVSSAGMKEEEYSRTTHDLTLRIARQLQSANAGMAFVYVSGAGTDSTEKGRMMWARVKGRTENALLAMFPNAFMFRPGFIQPLDGIKSRTGFYNAALVVGKPIMALVGQFRDLTTTRTVGLAMLNVVRKGFPKRVLEAADIRAAASE